MWSIGTIAALLLTGALIFAGGEDDTGDWQSRQAKIRAAAQCDLSMIDRGDGEWAYVNKRGKAFVKSLLILDEKRRLTAKQALQHPFLTCPQYASLLEKIYKHAIHDWTPRPKAKDIVRTIDTSYISASPAAAKPSSAAVKSGYFGDMQHASPPAPSSVPDFANARSSFTSHRSDGDMAHECSLPGLEKSPVIRSEDLQQQDSTEGAEQSFSLSIAETGGSYEYGTWPRTQFSIDASGPDSDVDLSEQ